MKAIRRFSVLALAAVLVLGSCKKDDEETLTELPAAFSVFDTDNTTIMLDGDEVVIESNGLPNHTSPYWSNTTERTKDGNTTAAAASDHALFSAPTVTSYTDMAPGYIDDFNGSYTLRVPAVPSKASSS